LQITTVCILFLKVISVLKQMKERQAQKWIWIDVLFFYLVHLINVQDILWNGSINPMNALCTMDNKIKCFEQNWTQGLSFFLSIFFFWFCFTVFVENNPSNQSFKVTQGKLKINQDVWQMAIYWSFYVYGVLVDLIWTYFIVLTDGNNKKIGH
jgi:hypothetical protein